MPYNLAIFFTAWAVVLYTYVVFPLLLAIFARLFGKDSHPSEDNSYLPRVAMVVAAFNEERVIADKLANTWGIDYPSDRFQLIVGSDGSEDGTGSILNSCDDPRLHANVFEERRGKISVLNDLMQSVDADIVVMSDANTMYARDSIRKLVAYFRDPKVGCVSGKLVLEENGGVSGEGLYWHYEAWIKKNESRMGFLIGCNGGIFAIRPELYDRLPANTIVEDFVLTVRVLEKGFKVLFEPDAIGVEPPCATARAEMVRKVRIGAGGFQAIRLNKALLSPLFGMRSFAFWGHKVLRWFAPLFLVAALAANVALAANPWFGAFLAIQIIGMVCGAIAYRLPAGTAPPAPVRAASYFWLMNYALLMGFFRFLFRTQKVTWDKAHAVVAVERTEEPAHELVMAEGGQ